jgi:hydrogenase nickel incorporation protein HypB
MQKTAEKLKDKITMAVMVGDLETERDAERIRETGIQALQIVTGGICHLEAQMVHQVLPEYNLEKIDLLFIENVGNLVCPASFDLGEDYRVTLMATTEGDDKPKKYPRMFLTSDMMLISKCDLLPYLPFSVDAVIKDALEVNHELEVMEISALKDEGIDAWCDWLLKKIEEKQNK